MKQILILTFLFTSSIWGQDYTWDKTIHWDSNNIEFTIRSPFELENSTLSSTRMKMENRIKDDFSDIFLKGVLEINISSLETISDVINREPQIYYKLDDLRLELNPYYSRLTTNLSYIDVGYKFNIYPDLIDIFYSNSQQVRVVKDLTHWDYGKFTGLIIYVPKELPLYGKNQNGKITPVLLPVIYNENMEKIQDLSFIEPDYMKKWGLAMYTNSFDETRYQERIGLFPLRIIAKGLFGSNNGDIIISETDSKKILGNIDNLKIITQGRILIIY